MASQIQLHAIRPPQIFAADVNHDRNLEKCKTFSRIIFAVTFMVFFIHA